MTSRAMLQNIMQTKKWIITLFKNALLLMLNVHRNFIDLHFSSMASHNVNHFWKTESSIWNKNASQNIFSGTKLYMLMYYSDD